jgi:hypothetical protein
MLPPPHPTPRLEKLNKIAIEILDGNLSPSELTSFDYSMIGETIVMFSLIDISLMRAGEALAKTGGISIPWAKLARATMADVVKTLHAAAIWTSEERLKLTQIEDHRGFRNMLAHFAILRFPTEDAFLLVTGSGRDDKRIFGVEPDELKPYAVVEAKDLKRVLSETRELRNWIGYRAYVLETLALSSQGSAEMNA